MKRNLTSVAGTLALAGCAFAATSTLAEAGWVRSGSGVGPHGRTWSSSGGGSCGGRSCSSSRQFIGPNGGTTTGSSSTSCAGGVCNHQATVTGPGGNTATRNSTWTHY